MYSVIEYSEKIKTSFFLYKWPRLYPQNFVSQEELEHLFLKRRPIVHLTSMFNPLPVSQDLSIKSLT